MMGSGPNPSPSSPSSTHPTGLLPAPDATTAAATNVSTIDIGGVVAKYNKMMDFLYPLELVGIAILYVVRWENYFLTLITLLLLCILFYYPALLAGVMVGSAIVGMAVGKYYSQTKLNTLQRMRGSPQVDYLNEDNQALTRSKKDQKASHKLLLEYKRIVCNAEALIGLVTMTLEYVYKIILWKSLEVSLCVTVLLCVLFTLLCTVYLRVLSASLPFIILCFNKHFIKRTVELWKSVFSYLYGKVRLKRRPASEDAKVEVQAARDVAEVVHHGDENSPPDNRTVHPVLEDHHSSRGWSEPQQTAAGVVRGGTPGGGGAGATGTGAEVGGEKDGGSAVLNTKGFCTKCNTSFAKLLKRKHDCNYCGQTYCGSCTVKVKRAVLGATSPAAFEESVRVCVDCKSKLDELKLAQNSIPPS